METPPRCEPTTTRNCLLLNLLILPGLGTVMAGGRLMGGLQIVLALTGFALTPVYFVTTARDWWRTGHFVCEFNHSLLWSMAGLGLFLIAWLWGLVSGLQIRRREHTKSP